MFCKKCGAQLQEGNYFCPMCGTNNAEDPAASAMNTGNAYGGNNAVPNGMGYGNAAPNSPGYNYAGAGASNAAGQSAGATAKVAEGVDKAKDAMKKFGSEAGNIANDLDSKLPEPLKKFGVVKLGIAAAAVAVLFVVLLLVILLGGSGSSAGLKVDKKAVRYVGNGYYMDASGSTQEADDVYSTYTSMDGSVSVYLDYSGDLYRMTDKLKSEKIASDVTTVRVGGEGEYIAYLCNEDSDYYNQVLYIYNVSKDKSKEIDKDVYGDYLTISVSGETVLYAKDYDEGDFDTYVAGYSKSAAKIDSKGRRPVAVSNNGKKAYLTEDSNLYYYNGKETEKVAKDVSSTFYANSDLSELVYFKNGDTYFLKPGKDAVKLSSNTIYSIVYPSSYGTCTLGSYAQALANDTIKGQIVYGGDGRLYWVNKNATEMVKIASNVYDAVVSDDGTSLVYVSNSKVYKVSKFSSNMNSKLLYSDESISSITASGDLKKIYAFSYEDYAVYYIKNSNKAVKICEDVDGFAYNTKDGKLYFVTDEELYTATTSSTKKKVSVDGDVSSVYATVNGVIVYTRDGSDYTYYYIGKKTVKLYEY